MLFRSNHFGGWLGIGLDKNLVFFFNDVHITLYCAYIMKLHLKHPIFDILSAYTDIEKFYACGGYIRNRQICYDGIPKDVKKVIESIVWGG